MSSERSNNAFEELINKSEAGNIDAWYGLDELYNFYTQNNQPSELVPSQSVESLASSIAGSNANNSAAQTTPKSRPNESLKKSSPKGEKEKSDKKENKFVYILCEDISSFKAMYKSIFYVGQGQNYRPLDHLASSYLCRNVDKLQAKWNKEKSRTNVDNQENTNVNQEDANNSTANNSPNGNGDCELSEEKISKILNIWQNNKGVYILYVATELNINLATALEGCIIETIGKKLLTNKILPSGYKKSFIQKWTNEQTNRLCFRFLLNLFNSLQDIKPVSFEKDHGLFIFKDIVRSHEYAINDYNQFKANCYNKIFGKNSIKYNEDMPIPKKIKEKQLFGEIPDEPGNPVDYDNIKKTKNATICLFQQYEKFTFPVLALKNKEIEEKNKEISEKDQKIRELEEQLQRLGSNRGSSGSENHQPPRNPDNNGNNHNNSGNRTNDTPRPNSQTPNSNFQTPASSKKTPPNQTRSLAPPNNKTGATKAPSQPPMSDTIKNPTAIQTAKNTQKSTSPNIVKDDVKATENTLQIQENLSKNTTPQDTSRNSTNNAQTSPTSQPTSENQINGRSESTQILPEISSDTDLKSTAQPELARKPPDAIATPKVGNSNSTLPIENVQTSFQQLQQHYLTNRHIYGYSSGYDNGWRTNRYGGKFNIYDN